MSTPFTPSSGTGGSVDGSRPGLDRTGDASRPPQDAGWNTVDDDHASVTPTSGTTIDSRQIRQAQQDRFGGMKFGSAFFGWLTATGMAVILIALLAAAGVAFGIADDATSAVDAAGQPTGNAQTVGLAGGIAFLVVLLLAYYCGGYVAGRMARFNGLRQGLAVWIWGVLIVLVVAAVAAIAGSQYDVLAQLNLPRLPVNEGQVTAVGAIVIGAALLAALVGALLGGLAGMRFHRKVDRTTDALPVDPAAR